MLDSALDLAVLKHLALIKAGFLSESMRRDREVEGILSKYSGFDGDPDLATSFVAGVQLHAYGETKSALVLMRSRDTNNIQDKGIRP